LAFIEQVLRLTRSDGRIGLIVPDDVLTGLRLKRFREWLLRKQVTLQAVVGLPRGLFPATLSKMSAVVMQKGQPPRGHRTLVAEVSRRDMRAQLRDIVEEIRKRQGRV
jgi:type I restriction enzyme M protein